MNEETELTQREYERYKTTLATSSEDRDLVRFVLYLDKLLTRLSQRVAANRQELEEIPREDIQRLMFSMQDGMFGNITLSQQVRALRQEMQESERRQAQKLEEVKTGLENKIAESYKVPYDPVQIESWVNRVSILLGAICLGLGYLIFWG